jgi:hypothetical protein
VSKRRQGESHGLKTGRSAIEKLKREKQEKQRKSRTQSPINGPRRHRRIKKRGKEENKRRKTNEEDHNTITNKG